MTCYRPCCGSPPTIVPTLSRRCVTARRFGLRDPLGDGRRGQAGCGRRHRRDLAGSGTRSAAARNAGSPAQIVRGLDLPDGVTSAQYSWTPQEGDDAYHWKSSGAVDLRIVVLPQLVESPGNEARPTVALHEATVRGSRLGFGTPWMHQWSAQIWPLNADAFLAGGGLSLADRVNAAPSAFGPTTSSSNRCWSRTGRGRRWAIWPWRWCW